MKQYTTNLKAQYADGDEVESFDLEGTNVSFL